MSALQIFGSADIARANEIMDEVNIIDAEVASYIQEYCSDNDIKLENLDIVAVTYEYILAMTGAEIESQTGTNFLEDNVDQIRTAGNYLATSYDFNGDAVATIKLIKTIPEADRSIMLKWFYNSIGGTKE